MGIVQNIEFISHMRYIGSKLSIDSYIERHESVGMLYHKCFGNDVSVSFVRRGLADVIFSHE